MTVFLFFFFCYINCIFNLLQFLLLIFVFPLSFLSLSLFFPISFSQKIEYVQKYATEEALTKSTAENGNGSSSDESSMSDFSDDDETRDMEM